MTLLATTYDFGETLEVDGELRKIISVHLYISDTGTITERYYLGDKKWLTIHVSDRKYRR